ncbi:MAG: 2-dehydropantoate 2-reductase N-terminal domain-containing protein [Mycobacterium sp.]|nr:2-dehydropantoate 2-reductase N-terminal domain-containing protein [Mycobacterium sp.]
MRILVIGAGVIGSVYAALLSEAGHTVTVCARGPRLAQLRDRGLILQDAETGWRTAYQVGAVATLDGVACDLVLVAVRRDQMVATVPLLANMDADVMFFGNAAGLTETLAGAIGKRTLFGFPAAGGVREDAVVRFVLIRAQKTMVADSDGLRSARARRLSQMFESAGFPATISTDPEGWLTAHAAFVVPIQLALCRVDVQPRRLAADEALLMTMVRATRQAFRALQAAGNTEIPRNLRALYLLMPERFAAWYWRKTLAGPHGELWFAAHTRAAPEEMASLAGALHAAVDASGRRAPDLEALLNS